MIKIEKNQNFTKFFNVFAFGVLIDQVESRAKARRIALQLASEHDESHIFIVDTNELPRCCIGVKQNEINAIPRMSLGCRTKFFGYILQFPLAHEPLCIDTTALIDSFNDADTHRGCKCNKLRTVLIVANEQKRLSTLMVGLCLIGHQPTCTSKKVGS